MRSIEMRREGQPTPAGSGAPRPFRLMRQRIGNDYALMEIQLALAAVAARYRLRLAPGRRVEPEASLTLHPRHGLRVTLAARP